jgi:N-acetylglucosamine-6-sulfatase
VEAVVTKLRNVGALENTYVVFTSDNGWHHGEHRIFNGKRQPYEESARVPLLVRGPGVGAGSTTDKLALNTDFFPTFMELAGAQTQTPSYVDGRSFASRPRRQRHPHHLEDRHPVGDAVRGFNSQEFLRHPHERWDEIH